MCEWCSDVACQVLVCFFFFKQKTAYDMRISAWSSDVCSSDLVPVTGAIVAWFALRSTPNRVHPRPAGGAGFLRAVLRNRPAARLTVGYTFHNWEMWGLWHWAPAFLAACFARSGSPTASEARAFTSASFHVLGPPAYPSLAPPSPRH